MKNADLILELAKYPDDADVLVYVDKKKRLQNVHAFIYSQAYNEITISFPLEDEANFVAKRRKDWTGVIGSATK